MSDGYIDYPIENWIIGSWGVGRQWQMTLSCLGGKDSLLRLPEYGGSTSLLRKLWSTEAAWSWSVCDSLGLCAVLLWVLIRGWEDGDRREDEDGGSFVQVGWCKCMCHTVYHWVGVGRCMSVWLFCFVFGSILVLIVWCDCDLIDCSVSYHLDGCQHWSLVLAYVRSSWVL